MRVALFIVLLTVLTGCQAPHPENPSFPIARIDAERALRAMGDDPLPLERPLVFISGWRDPALGAWWLSLTFKRFIDDDRILTVGYATVDTIEEARAKIIEAVEEAYPSGDPNWTVPVDVIGVSMGGLVGRYAAMPSREDPGAKRLDIERLFTLASPHRGAIAADDLKLGDKLMEQLRTDSEFITWINENDTVRRYQMFCYVRLGDSVVGQENAAPIGYVPWWLPNPPPGHAHIGGTMDIRFVTDIGRRLRGEQPFTIPPAAPLPDMEP